MSESITFILPCRNEGGNLSLVVSELTKVISKYDQVILVEGGSLDHTYEIAKKISSDSNGQVMCIKQNGIGKFDAVLSGVNLASNSTIAIWDTDNTIPIESGIRLIEIAREKSDSFITGNRLTGNRDKKAMPFLNHLGNYFFSTLWSLLTFSKPIDVLCGIKIFPKNLLKAVHENNFEIDRYGDISLLFAARKRKIRIYSVPVDYRCRNYGMSNIPILTGGVNLFKTTIVSWFRNIK